MNRKVPGVILHTEGNPIITNEPRLDVVNNYHRGAPNYFPKSSLGFFVGYHYWISKIGVVTQTRIDTELGAHTKGFNDYIGICLEGSHDKEHPTFKQTESLKKLLVEKLKQYNLTKSDIHYHREYSTKTCPGTLISDSWARDLLTDESDIAEKLSWIMREIARIQAIIQQLLMRKPLGFRDLEAPCG